MDYGGDWVRLDSHFDNIFDAMLTMFKVALTEGWLDIMYWGTDTPGPDLIMIRDYNIGWALFFAFFISVGAFFTLNLFDGVVIDNFFNEYQKFLGLGDFTGN